MALIDRGRVMTDYLENIGRKDSYKAKYEALSKAVDEAPAVDAVEIVCCIDCKHSAVDNYVHRRFCVRNGEVRPNGHIWYGVGVNDGHFCSYGEKMKEE